MQKQDKPIGQWVNGLDTLRFFLAFIVMLSHLPTPWALAMKASPIGLVRIAGEILPNLFCGVGAVIAFFIISGFVIHYPNKNGIKNVKKFLVRRWLRIGIPLLVISLIGIRIDAFLLIPIWSLYCELVYYTIYPLLVKLKNVSWTQKMVASFIFSLILITILGQNDIQSLIHRQNIHYSGAYWQTGNFITWIVGLPCWLMGVVLAEQYPNLKGPVSGLSVNLLRLAMIVACVFLDIGKFHFYLSYLISMNFFCFLLFYWIRAEIAYFMNRKSSPLLEYLGKFSYSIYLCHGVFLAVLEKWIVINSTNYFPVILAILLLSYLFYLVVEKPSHRIAQKAGALLDLRVPLEKEVLR